ncbi:MAG: endonuclease, partial [Limisphaerales bacterium]
MELLRFLLNFLVVAICVATALPFIRTDRWWVRLLDFPRLQWFFIGLVVLGAYEFLIEDLRAVDKGFIVLLVIALLVQVRQIFPYTALSAKQVKRAHRNGIVIRIFVANVLQENRNVRGLTEQIDALDPDIILLNETDEWWTEQLKRYEKSHPHTFCQPRDNTYG